MITKDENQAKHLYIIGNGFDRHHGLKTSYHHFAENLKEKDSSLFESLERYLTYPQSDEDLWWQFEENLANLDIDLILMENEDFLPDITSDEFRSRDMHTFPDIMDNIVRNLTIDLIKRFNDFISSVVIPNNAKKIILEIGKDALFFTFNYTRTLEDLYKINTEKINHIHHQANLRYYDIILGNGVNPEKFDIKPPEGLTDKEVEKWYKDQDDNFDYSYDTGRENLIKYFSYSFKPTANIITDNESYFASLSDIEEIHVLSHSLSEVDLPYFEKIIAFTKDDANWTVSYYNDAEKDKHLKTLKNLGIKEENITMITLEEIQISNKQLKLEMPQS